MSYTFYKILHFSGIFLVLLSLGAIAAHCLQGGTKANFKNRGLFMAFHGVGLLLAFVAGFGLMAKAHISFTSGWVYGKLLIWFILGAYPVIYYKKGSTKAPTFGLLGLLFAAIYLVMMKPF